MIPHYFVIAGILQMIYCLFLCYRLKDVMNSRELANSWKVMFTLILFFLLGYIGYLSFLDNQVTTDFSSRLLVSMILCFGATFVIVVLVIIKNSILALRGNTKELQDANRELRNRKSRIEKMERRIEQKNKELEKTLEDFYTLRLSMEKSGSNKISKENRGIRNRLDRIRLG